MPRRLATLVVLVLSCIAPWAAAAQPTPIDPAGEAGRLLEQNRLIADIARKDPDGLWALVSRLEILMRNARDGGTSRSGASATSTELEEIDANPALARAYANDPSGTLALLRATNAALHRASLRETPEAPRRLALVIGSNGDPAWGRLKTADNDATLVAGVLNRSGFTIFGGGALIESDKHRLLQAINDFTNSIGPDTVALVYYAGHGAQVNGRNFIVPAGAAIPHSDDDYDRNLVAIDDVVLRRMQQANARMNILVLDACRDHLPLSIHTPTRLGLAPMSAPAHMGSTLIMYSTEPNDVARDSVDGSPHSPFAIAFAAAIAEPGLEVRDAFNQVQRAVDKATDHRQEPWVSYSAIGKFYFTGNALPVDNAATQRNDAFTCPSAGTIVTLIASEGTVTGTYASADPRDPALCRLNVSTGQKLDLLYNYFDTSYPADQAMMRKELSDLLSGQKNRVSFEVTMRTSIPMRPPFTHYRETWTRVGGERMTAVDGRLGHVIEFERERVAEDAAGPNEKWRLRYYPAAGVFVRSDETYARNPDFPTDTLPVSYQVISVERH
jgi:hypothetical protein